jgi:rhomboid protease GluP
LWGFTPVLRQLGADFGFVPMVIGVSTTLYAATLLITLFTTGRLQPVGAGGFSLLPPSNYALRLFGMSGAIPIFVNGWWWTVLSATWLHGSLLHILFNMLWVRDLAPALIDVIGVSRAIIIYVVAGICGFALSSVMPLVPLPIPILHGATNTMGASAAIFGMLGALVHYGRVSGSRFIHAQALNYAIVLFVMALFLPGVDNTAHAGGFIGGYVTSAFFNPLTRERGDHMIAAVACLFATLVAILYSVVHGLGIL